MFAFFAPIHKLMGLTTALIAIDFITGLVAALKTKQAITSSRLARSIVKLAVYGVALCTCHIIETYFVAELPIVRMLTALIGLTEATSIFENLNLASGQNLLSLLLSQLKQAQDKNETPPTSPQ